MREPPVRAAPVLPCEPLFTRPRRRSATQDLEYPAFAASSPGVTSSSSIRSRTRTASRRARGLAYSRSARKDSRSRSHAIKVGDMSTAYSDGVAFATHLRIPLRISRCVLAQGYRESPGRSSAHLCVRVRMSMSTSGKSRDLSGGGLGTRGFVKRRRTLCIGSLGASRSRCERASTGQLP